MTRSEAFAISMGHVGSHDDLFFSHKIHHLRQDRILQFRTEKKISPFDVLHHGQDLEGFSLTEELGECFSLVLKPVVQAVDHVGHPHGAGFEKNRPKLRKTIQNAAANERGESHEHWKVKGDNAGRINMSIEVI